MPLNRARLRLSDIRAEIAGIRQLTAGATYEDFAENWAMKRAVQHALLIISEAARHLPDEYTREHANVPWQKIRAIGNLLRHEYRQIETGVIWTIVEDHLAELDAAAAAMLENAGKD